MNCEEVQSKLSEYFEKLPDPEIRESISNHLSTCDHCRAEADELIQTVKLVRTLPEVEPPVGFATRVMAHVREPATKPRFWRIFFIPFHTKLPVHAAAIILVSILAVYVYHKEPQQRQIQISEAESDRLGLDKHDNLTAYEAFAKKQAPKVPAGTSPPAAVEQALEGKKQKALSYRPDTPPATPQRAPQEKSSVPGEISGGRGLPGSATELRDELGTIPVPNEGSRDAMSSAGAAATGAEAKKETMASAMELKSKGKNALDQLAAPQRGSAPKSLRTGMGLADYELFIRLRSATPKAKTPPDALASQQSKNARTSLLLPAQRSDLDKARQRATETQEAQTLWLSIPRDQWARVKTDLAQLGQIEPESAVRLQAQDEVSKSGAPLRVKITILPPLPAPSRPEPR